MKTPKTDRSGNRVTNRLVALSSAAVLTVYSAGYLRTRAAADKLFAAERPRVVIPTPRGEQPLGPTRGAPAPAEARPVEIHAHNEADHEAHHEKRTAAVVEHASTEHQAKPSIADTEHATTTPSPAPSTAPVAPVTEPSPAPTPMAAASPTPSPSPTPAAPLYKDGTFSGWGTSRHGDIEATVVIESGKITSAVISQCWTRYSCSWVAHLQGQVVARQSAEVDYVTGATQSANAFYYAVVQALSKAK